MKVFKDGQGRDWSLTINVGTVKRIRSVLSINLTDAIDPEWLGSVVMDAEKLSEILWLLVKSQAEPKSITQEQFDEGLAGEAFGLARKSFLEELVDFFHQPLKGAVQEMITQLLKVQELTVAEAIKAMTSETTQRAIQAKIAGGFAGDSPASSESTPQI